MKRWHLPLLVLLGAWIGCTLFMWQVAIQNFAVAESVAAADSEDLREVIGDLSADRLRTALRYQSSEVNRLFFAGWGWMQLPLGAAVLLLACFADSGRSVQALAAIMTAIALGLAVYVVPETVRLGRMIDFVPEAALPEVHSEFWTLHHAYTAADSLKLALGVVAVALVWRGRKAGGSSA